MRHVSLNRFVILERILSPVTLVLLLVAVSSNASEWPQDILRDTFGYGKSTPADVPWDEVMQGCGARDCIPSIDRPRFIAASQAAFLEPDDAVLAISHGGESRAYPIAILNYHEIVNDQVQGLPIAITYCPLCGSGIAFKRNIAGRVLEFGVSGLLRNNDLILYDRATESLWQQITGRAFAGPLRGEALETLPVSMTSWSKWRAAHPNTLVLSQDTGFKKPYGNRTPYGDYETSRRLLFPLQFDRTLHPKTVVYGVEIDGASYAVTESLVHSAGELVQPGEPAIEWSAREDGAVAARRIDTGAELITHRMFWFAWYSFHTATEILTEDSGKLPTANQRPGQQQ